MAATSRLAGRLMATLKEGPSQSSGALRSYHGDLLTALAARWGVNIVDVRNAVRELLSSGQIRIEGSVTNCRAIERSNAPVPWDSPEARRRSKHGTDAQGRRYPAIIRPGHPMYQPVTCRQMTLEEWVRAGGRPEEYPSQEPRKANMALMAQQVERLTRLNLLIAFLPSVLGDRSEIPTKEFLELAGDAFKVSSATIQKDMGLLVKAGRFKFYRPPVWQSPNTLRPGDDSSELTEEEFVRILTKGESSSGDAPAAPDAAIRSVDPVAEALVTELLAELDELRQELVSSGEQVDRLQAEVNRLQAELAETANLRAVAAHPLVQAVIKRLEP